MSSRRLTATGPVPPATDPIWPATHSTQMEWAAPLLRPRSSSAEAAEGYQGGALRISSPPDVAGTTFRRAAGAVAKRTAAERSASPRLYSTLPCDLEDQTTRILLGTERLLRSYGHSKIRVADVAEACSFSAANVYRYFSSRRAILDTLASHYLRESERTGLAYAIRNSCSARERLSGFLTGVNTCLIIFSDSEPQISELLADATAEQWPCYSQHDARVVRRIAKMLADGRVSEEFRLEGDAEQEARCVKTAACALVEPDVVRLCRRRHDVRTREALSRLIATALLNQSVSSRCISPHSG